MQGARNECPRRRNGGEYKEPHPARHKVAEDGEGNPTPYGSHPAYARHLVERAERVCTQGTCDAALADEYLEGLWARLSEHLSGCVSFTAVCKALLENPNNFQLTSGRTVASGKAASRGGGRGKRESGGGSGGCGKRRRSSSGSSSGGSGSSSDESDNSEEDRRRKKRCGDAGRGSSKDKKRGPKKKKTSKAKRTPRSGGKRAARTGESEQLRSKWTKARLCFAHMRGQSCKGRRSSCNFEHPSRSSSQYEKLHFSEEEGTSTD